MLKFKKVISAVLAVAMLATVSTSVFAEEGNEKTNYDTETNTAVSGESTIERSQLTPEQQKVFDEHMERVQSQISTFSVGERREIGEIGGDKLYAVLEETEESVVARSNTTSTSTITVQYENVFGNVKDAFRVKLVCNWDKNGVDSYITKLTGTYTIVDSSFRCEWDKDYGSTTEPGYFALYLYAYHNSASQWYICSALCNNVADPPFIQFDV